MFVIDKHKKIILTKGDTASINVNVSYLDGTPYEIKSDDVITMMVGKTSTSEACITKLANSDHKIIFDHLDTNNLTPGLYVYDVQLQTENGNIYTIIPESFFEIRSEVTR